MKIRKLDRNNLTFEYNLFAQRTFPWENVVAAPFEGAWCFVPPGQQSLPHQHEEKEVFIIVKGQGTAVSDDETCAVEAGDVIYFEPGTTHSVINTSDEELVFFSIWWWDQHQHDSKLEL
ncbi:cupin domain-containing protein [Thermoactinomyces sp. CICC 10521]|uniref:cupin domain-containing protein n=1 Tax=Thermoactinomyces sp. CICC 10521 TaxID=2767426 RepID=UPI0018DC5A15|nr:cupin domain-containing protein [Thermoactinomyces sp. CICC 10521]MBH8608759.1 cupin domain-containing protein [Thermoactinomyces sp. CICC 10521]